MLEREAHRRQETYGRYDLARQWYSNQRQPAAIAKFLAQLAGLVTLECAWRERLAQEEGQPNRKLTAPPKLAPCVRSPVAC